MGSGQSSNKRDLRVYREPTSTPPDVQNALEQQRRLYEQKMKQMHEEAKRKTVPPVVQAPTELLEQQRHPHSYNQNQYSPKDLNTGSFYPNHAGAACWKSPQGNVPFSTNPYEVGYGGSVYAGGSYQYPQEPAQSSRSRSQSRQRGGENDVKCLTCGKMYGERIYRCNQGHSSCEVCKMRQVSCKVCRQQLTDLRNYDLEKYVMVKRVRCPYSMDGCSMLLKIADMAIHEKECPFSIALQCPSLGSCTWHGKLSQLSDHFNDMHPLHNQGEVDKEMFMSNVTNTSHTLHYVKIETFYFLFHVKVSETDARVYMAVQLIGTKHSVAKWEYEIHIYNKSQPRRKYQYIDRCSSTSEPLQEIVSSTKCAVIPLKYLQTLISGGAVAYKLYIKKDDFKTKEATSKAEDFRCGPNRKRHNKKYVENNDD